MNKLQIAQGTWIVVCDGAKALLLENVGDEKFPNLKTQQVFEEKHPATHEQGTDAPGRAMSSVGEMRSAVGQTDWHQQAEQQFLAKLADRLDTAVNAGQIKSLIVIAPPRALGVLRQSYSHQLRDAVRQEIDKDLVKLPVYEIEKYLVG